MYIDLSWYEIKRKEDKNVLLYQKWWFGFETLVYIMQLQWKILCFEEKRMQYSHQHYFLLPMKWHMIRVPCYIENKQINLITFYYSRQDTKKFL